MENAEEKYPYRNARNDTRKESSYLRENDVPEPNKYRPSPSSSFFSANNKKAIWTQLYCTTTC